MSDLLSVPTTEDEIEHAVMNAKSKQEVVDIIDEVDAQFVAGKFSCPDEFWPKLTWLVGDKTHDFETT